MSLKEFHDKAEKVIGLVNADFDNIKKKKKVIPLSQKFDIIEKHCKQHNFDCEWVIKVMIRL